MLSPENEAVNPNRIDFSGQIFYTDGSPCANRVIELHSDPRRTTTDSEGVFHFKDVETGTHNLALLDDSGRQESQVEIHIDRESGIQTGKVTRQRGGVPTGGVRECHCSAHPPPTG